MECGNKKGFFLNEYSRRKSTNTTCKEIKKFDFAQYYSHPVNAANFYVPVVIRLARFNCTL